MSTLTTTIKLASSDLSTNTLSLTTTATQSPTSSSGLSRAKITSTSKVSQISCTNGNGDRATTAQEGQFLDITDNHGVLRRYVFIDGSSSTVATGTIIANDTDVGSTSTPAAILVGGVAVDTGDHNNVSQAMELTALKAAIEHANGHAGSITVATITGTGAGVQSLALSNATTGEGGSFIVDKANSTLSILNAATNSQASHTTILSPSTYTSAPFLYVKNTASNAAHTATIYNAAFLGQNDIMTLSGGQSAFLPANVTDNLKAYTSNSGTILEFMHVGVE
tara:strand:+ start:387 stop:1226 length:840 start_codon:yes stop_codon:yes gene_type:complete